MPTGHVTRRCGHGNVYGAEKYETQEVDGFTITRRILKPKSDELEEGINMNGQASTEASSKVSALVEESTCDEIDLSHTQ